MATSQDPFVLEQLRDLMLIRSVEWTEKRMFGGVCFLVDEKMFCGTFGGGVMLRVGPERVDDSVAIDGVEQVIHGGRKMTGFVRIENDMMENEEVVGALLDHCIAYNPIAKSSKKRKTKKSSRSK